MATGHRTTTTRKPLPPSRQILLADRQSSSRKGLEARLLLLLVGCLVRPPKRDVLGVGVRASSLSSSSDSAIEAAAAASAASSASSFFRSCSLFSSCV
ncbi:hypothetical protein TYRP_001345 [Tyrophagus putrescentiae]|nr:hypothetical protein TYRP_001345 [Tyrophagus putrescentiae]